MRLTVRDITKGISRDIPKYIVNGLDEWFCKYGDEDWFIASAVSYRHHLIACLSEGRNMQTPNLYFESKRRKYKGETEFKSPVFSLDKFLLEQYEEKGEEKCY